MGNCAINIRRDKVLNYLSRIRTDSLFFNRPSDYDHKMISPKDDRLSSIDIAILDILCDARNFSSFNTTHDLETPPKRRRSSIDIWRHLPGHNIDIDIFAVMESLYKLSQYKYLRPNYCHMVKRTVFVIHPYLPHPLFRDISNLSLIPPTFNFISEEYSIAFSTWKKLHI